MNIGKFLASPRFESAEENRIAQLLNPIVLAVFVAALAFPGVLLFTGTIGIFEVIAGIVVALLMVLLKILMNRGHLQLSSILMSSIIFAVTTVLIYYDGTILNGLTAFYLLVVIMAALLTGNRSATVFMVLSLLAMFIMLLLEINGLTTPDPFRVGAPTFITYATALVITLVLVVLANRGIRAEIIKSTEAERRQAEISLKLEKANASLTSTNRALELAIDITHRISQVRDPEKLLVEAVELIREFFNLYYVQIYLASGQSLILKAGSGEIGQQLARRGHRLPISTTSINGTAAIEKKNILIADTQKSRIFRPNPLLPSTRFELAVPLIVGERLVGILDIQDDHPESLSSNDIPAFETIAGQLAIAIENANLFEQVRSAQTQLEQQTRRITQEYWREFLNAIDRNEWIGYVYQENTVTPLSSGAEIKSGDSSLSQSSLTVPITIAGQAVGALSFKAEKEWGEDEKVLVDTVAQLIGQQAENLRILADAQRSRMIAEQATLRLTQEGWLNYLEQVSETSIGFIYDQDRVEPLSLQELDNSDHDISDLVSQPIRVQNQVIGELNVPELTEIDNDTRAVLETLANQLSIHLDNLRLFEQTQSALGETSLLYNTSHRLTAATNLHEVVSAIAEGLNIPQVNRVILIGFEYDEAGNLQFVRSLASWFSKQGTPPPPLGIYDRTEFPMMDLLIGKEPTFCADISNDHRISSTLAQSLGKLKVRSLAVLPLWVSGIQIGSLLFESEHTHNFTRNEIRSLSALIGQVSTSVQNHLLLQSAQNRAFLEQKIREITTEVYNAPSIDSMLRIAAREIGQVLGRQTFVYLGKELVKGEKI